MPVPVSIAPRKQWLQAMMEDNGAGLRRDTQLLLPTIPTTGVVDVSDLQHAAIRRSRGLPLSVVGGVQVAAT